MRENLFFSVSCSSGNPKYNTSILRQEPIYKKENDIRSEFARDYTRILHSNAYRRLKHKTQVFFATRNDHVCTRMEHVSLVSSVSYTISKFLGLNTELTNSIAIGHDLGHAPFGHAGEKIIKAILQEQIKEKFWHERNSLRFIDECETLEDPAGKLKNLNLTYAVRDGIICHCGEIDENALRPRDEFINSCDMTKPNEYSPYTWEGCIVKISDKISYIGRDIEDALTLNILDYSQLKELRRIAKINIKEINNTILMHDFIIDLCTNSSPKKGICFSKNHLELINLVKAFNYDNIYYHKRLKSYIKYAELVINSIYTTLSELYNGEDTLNELEKYKKQYPLLIGNFYDWLWKFSDLNPRTDKLNKFENHIIYTIKDEKDYVRSIVDYISGMTDNFAINVFNELTSF